MDSLQLNKVVQQIESSFGEELPVTGQALSDADREVVARVMRGETYQTHLQDQLNRQIIRDYLLNATMLGCITDESLTALSKRAASPEGRSVLSLHMLMSSVDSADEISPDLPPGDLKSLRPEPGSPPYMVIVGS